MIKACISSVQYSVLINGKPRGQISPSRGICQGDPISPSIFVLAMDYLSRLLTDLESKRKIKGVNFRKQINLTHILFADNIIIFIEDRGKYISSLKFILHLFESAWDLNLNLNKSTITPINVDTNRADFIVENCGIKKEYLSINYLGVPLGLKPPSLKFWDNIVEKIQKKLSSWKFSYISKGGRITLINSSLESLPTYHMYVFKAFKEV